MAIATLIIAMATLMYVHYSQKQWEAINGQLEQMKQQVALAKQTAYFDQRPILISVPGWPFIKSFSTPNQLPKPRTT
jgi:hypothetical protein